MTKTRWFRLTTRAVVGGGVLIAIVAHVGTGPFLRGLLNLDIQSIVVATLLAFIATAGAGESSPGGSVSISAGRAR